MSIDDSELETLIARCAIRDQKALKTLYDRTAPMLNHIAYQIVKSDEISNEVLQDAFVKIWQNASTYRPHLGKPLTWMCSIVRYRAIDCLRSESRHQQRPDAEEEAQALANTSGKREHEPEIDTHLTQTRKSIHECLDNLDDKVKQCVELAYLYGYSREELAESLGAKVNTIKSWLYRGSERLRQCLETKMNTH